MTNVRVSSLSNLWDVQDIDRSLHKEIVFIKNLSLSLKLRNGNRTNLPLKERAIAQAISRRLPTAAARVSAQVSSCGICGEQSGTGAALLRVLRFPCQFSFHRLFHTHHLSSRAGTIGQLVADVPSGLSLTPPQEEPPYVRMNIVADDSEMKQTANAVISYMKPAFWEGQLLYLYHPISIWGLRK
jgi:hypothetical protein